MSTGTIQDHDSRCSMTCWLRQAPLTQRTPKIDLSLVPGISHLVSSSRARGRRAFHGLINLDNCIHAANILLLAAYSVRDILWLRLFAVASSTIAMPYFLIQPIPLWATFGWSVLFTLINLYQCWRLFRERKPIQLSAEEAEVRRLVFPDLAPREALRVINLGSWADPAMGERLIERGKAVDAISVILRGRVQVSIEGRVLGEVGPGGIVGSSLALSGAPAEVDAATVEPARTLRWDVPTLNHYLDSKPETRNVLQRQLARDLASKVHHLAKVASGRELLGPPLHPRNDAVYHIFGRTYGSDP